MHSFRQLMAKQVQARSSTGEALSFVISVTVENEAHLSTPEAPLSTGDVLLSTGVAHTDTLFFWLSLKTPLEASMSEPIWSFSTLRAFSTPISRVCFFFGGDLTGDFLPGFFRFFGDFVAFGNFAVFGDFIPLGDFVEVRRPFFLAFLYMKQIYANDIKTQSYTYMYMYVHCYSLGVPGALLGPATSMETSSTCIQKISV